MTSTPGGGLRPSKRTIEVGAGAVVVARDQAYGSRCVAVALLMESPGS